MRRITVGMLIAALAFVAVALIQQLHRHRDLAAVQPYVAGGAVGLLGTPGGYGPLLAVPVLAAGSTSHVWFGWQIIAYLLMTVAEVMVSITGLEFAYTQAPARMKSTIMGFWLLTIALGNVLVVFLAGFETLPRVTFFWTFAVLCAIAGLLFGLRAYFYTPKDYPQE